LISCRECRVLLWSTKIFKVQVLVNGKAEENLIVNIDLLFWEGIWIERWDWFMNYSQCPFLCCLNKVKVNFSISPISLDSLIHSTFRQLFAGLKFFVPISLIFLINSEKCLMSFCWLILQGIEGFLRSIAINSWNPTFMFQNWLPEY